MKLYAFKKGKDNYNKLDYMRTEAKLFNINDLKEVHLTPKRKE